MIKYKLLGACAFSVIAVAASPAAAQSGPAAPQDTGTPDIVITGSIIKGTPEDAALPVNVISGAELEKQGAPSAVELLKALPTSSAVLGDSNQFDSRSQGAEGIATANLRGLSPQRTLVLLNNKRLVTAGNGVPAVDINLIPAAAVGRIEVLKDGAAATYGSEAIAGVVNFITRTDQNGFRAAGSYKYVKGGDGDFDGSISFGHVGDNWRFLAAASFTKRAEISVRDRPYLLKPYTQNPQGGYTGGGNPATFLGIAASGAPVTALTADVGCAPLGGYVGANNRCYTQYSSFDNLADLEKRGTAFVDFEADLTDKIKFEVTGLYGRSTVPHYLTSPSYILTQAPSLASKGGTNPTPFVTGFYVPASNPGFIAYRAANPALLPAAATGAVFPLLLYRPFLIGGNPSTLSDPDEPGSARGMRKSESTRFTAELTGKLGSLDWSLAGTYHGYYRYTDGFDSYGDRVQLALRGFGGPNCTGTTPGANGCLYLNPFSNAITNGAVNGTTNPQGSAALANSSALTDWLFVKGTTKVLSRLYVADASLGGKTGITLPGGEIQFGVGAQYRYNKFATTYGTNSNIVQNPCRDTPITGQTNPAACSPLTVGGLPSAPNGAFAFLGTGRDNKLQGGVYALFGEAQLPVFDGFNVQLAARYEDYGGGVGSTFDPQIRARWQITDFLAVRGGYGTTFRAPTLSNISTGFVTALQLIGSTFTPVDVNGNPNLKPESSKNYSGGVLLKFGGFNASVDYFRYELSDVIVSDPLSAMVATLFPTGAPNTCAANPTLADRFTFTTGTGRAGCSAATTVANVARVNTFLQNGAKQTNSGLDFAASYKSNQLFGSDVRFGVGIDATYTIENRISQIVVAGVTVAKAYDGVGLLNYQSTLYPVPEWKGQAYLDLGFGPVDIRLTGNYTDGLHDQRFDTRSGPFAPDASLRNPDGTIPTTPISLLTGADIGDFVTADLNVQIKLPLNFTLSGTVINMFDAKAPFAREDYNYEPFIGNPFGRQYKVGLSTKF